MNEARLSHLLTHRTVAMGGGNNVAVYNGVRTFVETWNSEAEFDAVRVIYASVRGGSRFGIGGAIVRAVSRPWNTASDDRDADDRCSWLPLRFAQVAGRVEFPPLAETGDGVNVWTPSLFASDLISVPSVPRGDGGPGCLLEVRTLLGREQSLTGPYTTHRSGIDASDPEVLTGRSGQKLFGFADLVSTKPRIRAADLDLGTFGQGAAYAIQFRTRRPGATVQAVGDSIVQGSGFEAAPYVSGHFSFAHLVCAGLSSPERPVALLQSGVGGEPSLDFIRSARVDLDQSDVAIALIQTWSGNDINRASSAHDSLVAADAAWGRAMHYGELVRSRGGVPIFLSAVPQAPKMASAGAEAARWSSVERCAVLASKGERTLDLNSLLGDESAITNYKPALGCDDNIHPNAAGNRVISDALTPLLRAALGQPE